MRILWYKWLNKTGLDCVLEEPRRCMLGVNKTGLERVLELINAWHRNVF